MCRRLNNFCYCCSLKTGAILVTLGNVLSLIVTVALAVFYILKKSEGSEKTDNYIFAGILILIAVSLFIVTVFLILAIVRNKASFVIPWLTLAIISVLVYTGAVIRDVLNKDFYSLFLVAAILALLYTWVAMFSYYLELKEGVVITPKEKSTRAI